MAGPRELWKGHSLRSAYRVLGTVPSTGDAAGSKERLLPPCTTPLHLDLREGKKTQANGEQTGTCQAAMRPVKNTRQAGILEKGSGDFSVKGQGVSILGFVATWLLPPPLSSAFAAT